LGDIVVVTRRESFALSLTGEVAPTTINSIVRGALTELCGPAGGGKTELVLRFLAENPTLRVAWIEDPISIYPCAFPRHGVSLNRVLFVRDPGEHAIWCVQQILRSGIFPVVVLAAPSRIEGGHGVPLRRLQLAAEQANASVILLSERPTEGAWAIANQIEVRRQAPPAPQSQPKTGLRLLKGRESWCANET
jgi:hypothetical protein